RPHAVHASTLAPLPEEAQQRENEDEDADRGEEGEQVLPSRPGDPVDDVVPGGAKVYAVSHCASPICGEPVVLRQDPCVGTGRRWSVHRRPVCVRAGGDQHPRAACAASTRSWWAAAAAPRNLGSGASRPSRSPHPPSESRRERGRSSDPSSSSEGVYWAIWDGVGSG